MTEEENDRLRPAALVVPLILVNLVALYGQVAWAQDNLTADLKGAPGLVVACVFAAALESIGIYLAAEAHAALMAGDSSGKLRVGSYAVAALVGTLNYRHWTAGSWSPTPAAVAFGALSTISPWLWAIRSRSLRRAELREQGLIEPRAVKFSTARWLLYPRRTFRAYRAAVWEGVTDPAAAIALVLAKPPAKARDAKAESKKASEQSADDGPDGNKTEQAPGTTAMDKAEAVAHFADLLHRNPQWRPDWKGKKESSPMQVTGWSKSWCEQRIAEARKAPRLRVAGEQ